MRGLDFNSWKTLLSTMIGLALVTLIGVGIRLALMQTVQHRRERENRQINERLRTLIAAYKVLGGSFTGNLAVDPILLSDLQRGSQPGGVEPGMSRLAEWPRTERSRRKRHAVESALSDVLLLGTDEQVRLAAHAAAELAAGRPVYTHELVVSLRNFIRSVLDLDPVPGDLLIPPQGPSRPSSPARDKGEGGASAEAKQGGDKAGMAGMGGAAGVGMGLGLSADAEHEHRD
ncbi:hypothetical protein [Lysobacter niastensis]|uniref:Uncharacterized protein n=1 Tax=Lysobacter niastensis TaxID=380629 RepID=A0ABS0B8T8_9GAMM|nr:hypothetical protein [Lysobacter niastensis]MBF6025435.1 hypothetical protein [Lysobacter niastensis]